MVKFAILFCSVACALGASIVEDMPPPLDGRIVGGELTTISSYPWQVAIQKYGRYFCGGVVFNDRYIITAAHCLENAKASSLSIRAGSSFFSYDGVVARVAAFTCHEGYNTKTSINDIAVIRLSSALPMSSTIKAIPLATTTPPEGALATVSGWGRTSSGGETSSQLRCAHLNILSRKSCTSSAYGYGLRVKKTMLCACNVDTDSCQGDSGGPLVSNNTLVGIVSWGVGCANPRYPGIYANVADFHSWIINTTSTL